MSLSPRFEEVEFHTSKRTISGEVFGGDATLYF
jgi:hypothetical protein